MTLQQLFAAIDQHPLPVLAYFTGLPLLAWVTGRLRGTSPLNQSPLRWLYSAILYAVCVPGIAAAVVFADNLARGQLLQAGVLSQILPLLAMLATLALVWRQADAQQIPGFRRIIGFMSLLALTALGLFLLMRTRIWVFFGGGIGSLLLLMAALFAALKWAFDRAFGSGR